MLQAMVQWLVEMIGHMGYTGIFILMTIESSFIPFPSEVVMIPAGYLAYKGEMNLLLSVAVGLLGSLAGAYVNYYLALWIGRPMIERYGKYFFLNQKKFDHACSFFKQHGEISTFICRLLPGIRQVISIPAGLAHMSLGVFSFYTGLGAGIWVFVLTYIGYWVGGNEALVREYSKKTSVWLAVFCCVLIVGYIYFYKKKKTREE